MIIYTLQLQYRNGHQHMNENSHLIIKMLAKHTLILYKNIHLVTRMQVKYTNCSNVNYSNS
jgi:hypothetical protein